jgi:hypothetical protein
MKTGEGSHMSLEMLRRLARRELAPREIAEVLRHIGECEECAQTAAADAPAGMALELDALDVLHAGDAGPWHPDHAELTTYVDGAAGPAEREIVESHAEDCGMCRVDLADLAALRRHRPRSAWRVAITAAAAAGLAAVMFLQRSDDVPAPLAAPSPVVATTATTATTATATTSAPAPEPRPRYENAEWERLVGAAIASATLPFPRDVGTQPDVLRGSTPDAASKVSPAGVVLVETRPRFSWPERTGATYVVSVFDGDRQIVQSEPLAQTHWIPSRPLPRGRTYVWQVQVTRDGAREIVPAPPAPPATFRIVSHRVHDDLATALRLHPEDHLLYAVLTARAGLREEAIDALHRASADERTKPLRERYLHVR